MGCWRKFKLFSRYHGLEQMKIDKLWISKDFSYYAPTLIANWKLTEPFTSSDTEISIKDYSWNQLSLKYSLVSDPLLPSFNDSVTETLNLCYFHDVANCHAPITDAISPFVFGAWWYGESSYLNLADSDYTITDGDEIIFVERTSDC